MEIKQMYFLLDGNIETTVSDACRNSRSMWGIGLIQFPQISLNSTRRSLCLSFVSLPGQSTYRQSPFTSHFLLTEATVNFGMLKSLVMSLKNRSFLRYPTITLFSKSDNSEFCDILHVINDNAVSLR
ncbi:hypothetical protein TNCV_61191 [Trichonephila clavipes]|nr:hypothetical protein TNCV_61191 [Trichonephila clavipes]